MAGLEVGTALKPQLALPQLLNFIPKSSRFLELQIRSGFAHLFLEAGDDGLDVVA